MMCKPSYQRYLFLFSLSYFCVKEEYALSEIAKDADNMPKVYSMKRSHW